MTPLRRFLPALAVALVPAADAEPKLALGKQVFTERATPSCTICHTLADAEASGEIGPNLDQLAPTEEQVALAVSNGVGVMPAFGDSLSAEEIAAVAHYVAEITAQ